QPVEVSLMKTVGTSDAVEVKKVTLDESNSWKQEIKELPTTEKVAGKLVKIEYSIKEVNVSDRLTSTVTGDMKTGFVVTNTEKLGILEISKIDSSDSTKVLAGAEFKIINENNETIATVTTNEWGVAQVIDLPFGNYQVVETKAPVGYILDTQEKQIEIKKSVDELNKNSLIITNTKEVPILPVEKGKVMIKKIDSSDSTKVLSGAEFRLTSKDGSYSQTGLTDENGQLIFDQLDLGLYTLKEIAAPSGYEISEKEINVSVVKNNNNNTIGLSIPNIKSVPLIPIEPNGGVGSLKVIKFDIEQSDIKLSGAQFELVSIDNPEKVFSAVTGNNGELVFEKIPSGNYNLIETQAPTGYELDTTPQLVVIEKDQEKIMNISNKKIEIPIVPEFGDFKVVKIDASDKENHLAGAEFTLTSVANSEETFVLVTDENGEAKVQDLEFGQYTLTETKAPVGYEIDQSDRTITIGQTELGITIETVTNQKIKDAEAGENVDKPEKEKPVKPEKPEQEKPEKVTPEKESEEDVKSATKKPNKGLVASNKEAKKSKGKTLPQTGDSVNPLMIGAGVLIVLVGLVLILKKRKTN
ncbi:MAG: MSCRAMM family protein, partial [Vagococcus sp.]